MPDPRKKGGSEPRSHGAAPPLHIRLLGGFGLSTSSGAGLVLPGTRQRALLAYLLLHRDRPSDRRHLAFLLWPESTESQALTNLRQLIHDVRAAIPEADRFLQADRNQVRWRGDSPCILDVDTFEAGVVPALQAGPALRAEATIAVLTAGVSAYAGDLLPECYDEWVEPVRRRLRELLVAALRRLITLLEERRQFAAATLHAQRLRDLEPLDELATLTLMRLHAGQGQRAQALDAYARIAAQLQDELEAQPALALQELRDRLLHAGEGDGPAPAPSAAEPAFVNRAAEWTRLARAWTAVNRGRPRSVLVSGIPGIGKTRLCEEFTAWAGRQGATVIGSKCYGTVGSLPYGPVIDWLRAPAVRGPVSRLPDAWRAELLGLLPELAHAGAPAVPPVSRSSAEFRRRLFDAVLRAIAVIPPPVLLLLDDVQWADPETLEWIRFLMGSDELRSVMLLVSYRVGEPAAGGHLESLLRDLRREGQLDEIALDPLDSPDTAALAAAAAGEPLEASAAEALYRETEGNPLFIVEMVRASVEGSARAASDPVISPRAFPERVIATIEARLALLSPEAHDALGVASAIGREFRTDLLGACSGTGMAAILSAVEELLARRLIDEQGPGTYDFSHDSIREVVYASLSGARRQLLHQRIAQAQIAAAAGTPEAASAIARHLERGGFTEGAIPFYKLAAEHALGLFAGAEAVKHFERALGLLGQVSPSSSHVAQEIELRTALCVALVNLEMYSGPRMMQEYARLSALCEKAGIEPGPPALRTLAIALVMRGEVAEAGRIGQRLLAGVPPAGDAVLLTEAEYVLGIAAFWQGDAGASCRHLRTALDAYLPSHAAEHLKTFGQDAGVVCGVRLAHALWMIGQPDLARQVLAEALGRAETLGHPHTLAYARQFGAWALIDLGDEAAARRLIESAVEVAETHSLSGWPVRNAALLGFLMGRSGETERGIAMMENAASEWASRGWRLAVPYDRALLARLCLAAGRTANGLEAIAEGLDTAHQTGQVFWNAELLRLRGQLLEASGAPGAEIRRTFSEALEVAQRQGAEALVRRAAHSLQTGRNAGRTLEN